MSFCGRTWPVVLALAMLALVVSPVAAVRVAGGGSPKTDCFAEFEVDGTPAVSGTAVECLDGAGCEPRGICTDGRCLFRVALCLNQRRDGARCTPPAALREVRLRGRARGLGLEIPRLDDSACGGFVEVPVPVDRTGRRPTRLRTVAVSRGRRRDRDVLTLVCRPGGVGAPDCQCNSFGGPSKLIYRVADHGTDLDIGISGPSHNFSVVAGATLTFCLAGCDASTNPVCEANAPVGPGSINGETFGPPQPVFAAGTPLCMVNRFRDPAIRATVNVETGGYESRVGDEATPLGLEVGVFATTAGRICPRCVDGVCDSGPRGGQNCTVDTSVRIVNPSTGAADPYDLSVDCPPGGEQGSRIYTLNVTLPLTTGVSRLLGPTPCPGQTRDDDCGMFGAACTVDCAGKPDRKGGQNQWCCSDAGSTPCFPTAPASGEPEHAIVRTGRLVPPEPPWPDPDYPKTALDVKLGAVFCIQNTVISASFRELGEPGALILNGSLEFW